MPLFTKSRHTDKMSPLQSPLQRVKSPISSALRPLSPMYFRSRSSTRIWIILISLVVIIFTANELRCQTYGCQHRVEWYKWASTGGGHVGGGAVLPPTVGEQESEEKSADKGPDGVMIASGDKNAAMWMGDDTKDKWIDVGRVLGFKDSGVMEKGPLPSGGKQGQKSKDKSKHEKQQQVVSSAPATESTPLPRPQASSASPVKQPSKNVASSEPVWAGMRPTTKAKPVPVKVKQAFASQSATLAIPAPAATPPVLSEPSAIVLALPAPSSPQSDWRQPPSLGQTDPSWDWTNGGDPPRDEIEDLLTGKQTGVEEHALWEQGDVQENPVTTSDGAARKEDVGSGQQMGGAMGAMGMSEMMGMGGING